MKVLLIFDKELAPTREERMPARLPPGANGMAVYLAHLERAFIQKGCTVCMIRFRPDPAPSRVGDWEYRELRSSGNRFRPGVQKSLRRAIESMRPDIVHLHSVFYAMNAAMIRRLTSLPDGAPVVHTFHDVTPICHWRTKLHPDGTRCTSPVGLRCVTGGCFRLGARQGFGKDLFNVLANGVWLSAMRKLPAVIVPSGYLREQLLLNGFEADRVHVIPNFSRFGCSAGERIPPEEPNRILFAGRLTREKGAMALFDALRLIRHLDWKATIIGDGELRGELTTLATRNFPEDRIYFSGVIGESEMCEWYRRCGLAVVPSMMPESFGMVGVEAMSFGRPVVAFDSGGIREWLEDGVTGLLVEHGDIAGLAEGMSRLLSDAALRERMGAAGQSAVERRFRLEHHADELLRLYESTARKSQKRIIV